ncbi:MAG: 16S rRNA (uracil(1498)-N(3))-methyltransferase [Christensenellaceae bacterium]|jgi:16S rRNA (uracil1498-N3)-methyltransferase
MKRFFFDGPKSGTVKLTGEEARHISRVLRMDAGDMLHLFDGSGYDYLAKITSVQKDGVFAEILQKGYSQSEPGVFITVYQAVIKKDNMDYVTQKCTETGASRIVPYLSQRCVKRPDEASAAKLLDRQRHIAKEAAKQCGRAKIPEIGNILSLDAVAQQIQNSFTLLAYENEKRQTIRDVLASHFPEEISVIIGPEGGFTQEEVQMLEECGARPCSLGRLILRSETAGVAACAMLLYHYMDGVL